MDTVGSPLESLSPSPVASGTDPIDLNLKRLDRFRDPFSPSGAKDDRRDARVLADSLRTDPHCFMEEADASQRPLEAAGSPCDALQWRRDALQRPCDTLHRRHEALQSRRDALQRRSGVLQWRHTVLQWRQGALATRRRPLRSPRDAVRSPLENFAVRPIVPPYAPRAAPQFTVVPQHRLSTVAAEPGAENRGITAERACANLKPTLRR